MKPSSNQETSDSHIPTDWFDKIQLTITPNNITASVEYTTKDGPAGRRETIPLLPPGPRQTDFDRRMAPVLDYFREMIQKRIERDRTNASTTE